MKKIILLLPLLIGFISCSNREDQLGYESKRPLDKSYISTNIEGRKLGRPKPNGGVLTFTMDIGRKSRGCRGFGICQLSAFGIEIVSLPTSPMGRIIKNDNGIYQARIDLNAKVDDNSFDTIFYIDEDIIVPYMGKIYTFKKGEYNLQYTDDSEFGSYFITVDVI